MTGMVAIIPVAGCLPFISSRSLQIKEQKLGAGLTGNFKIGFCGNWLRRPLPQVPLHSAGLRHGQPAAMHSDSAEAHDARFAPGFKRHRIEIRVLIDFHGAGCAIA